MLGSACCSLAREGWQGPLHIALWYTLRSRSEPRKRIQCRWQSPCPVPIWSCQDALPIASQAAATAEKLTSVTNGATVNRASVPTAGKLPRRNYALQGRGLQCFQIPHSQQTLPFACIQWIMEHNTGHSYYCFLPKIPIMGVESTALPIPKPIPLHNLTAAKKWQNHEQQTQTFQFFALQTHCCHFFLYF